MSQFLVKLENRFSTLERGNRKQIKNHLIASSNLLHEKMIRKEETIKKKNQCYFKKIQNNVFQLDDHSRVFL